MTVLLKMNFEKFKTANEYSDYTAGEAIAQILSNSIRCRCHVSTKQNET